MPLRTFVAFDVETTGLDAKKDAIIEFGGVRFSGEPPFPRAGQPCPVQDQLTSFVNPGRPLPLRIQQITGIRPADLADAPPLATLQPEIVALLGGSTDALVAHSAGFDVGFLAAAGIRVQRPVLDTYELATILLPGQASYSLGELCQALDVPLAQAHRAGDDAAATAGLMTRLLARIDALPTATLAVLCAAGADSDWPPLLLFQDALQRRQGEEFLPVDFPRTSSPPPPLDAAPPAPRPVPPALLDAAFAPDGPLAAEFDSRQQAGFEPRTGQLAMARLVLDALNRGDHKIIEAGTGTGKSLAYLLPAAAWATANRSRVLIATHTLPLQDQLLEQELPRVQRALAALADADAPFAAFLTPVRAQALKGRSRYLCTRRLAQWLAGGGLSPLALRLLAKILVWLPHTSTGDLSELAIHDWREQALLPLVASLAGECSPSRCTAQAPPGQHNGLGYARHRDFYLDAHRQAQSAHLLIVNHALLLADVEAGGQVLPAYENLIIDEAHRLEDAATEQLTRRVESGGLGWLLAASQPGREAAALLAEAPRWVRLVRQVAAERRAAASASDEFFQTLLQFVLRHKDVRPRLGYPQRVALDSRVRAQPAWSEVEIEWDRASEQIGRLLSAVAALADGLDAARWWQEEESAQARFLAQLRRAHRDLSSLRQVTDDVILRGLQAQEESVAWLELNADADGVTLASAPVQVSRALAAGLFGPRRALVLTGATLRAGDRFDFLQDRLGCWEATGAVIDSPFDYKRNVLLYLPSDMPTPDRPTYQPALEQAIVDAAQAAGGRTLVLFTSHGHLRATGDAIRAPLAEAGITLLQHGEGSRRRNLRDFRADPKAVLLGTGTYWEGVDLPGDQLVCLLIARLPFAVPTDPLFAARSGLYEDAFNEYAVPDAVLRLRQGFGRLIRSATDRGVVVLLDSRLWQRSYGEAFLDGLPACTTRRSPLFSLGESVENWLANEPILSALADWGFADDW